MPVIASGQVPQKLLCAICKSLFSFVLQPVCTACFTSSLFENFQPCRTSSGPNRWHLYGASSSLFGGWWSAL